MWIAYGLGDNLVPAVLLVLIAAAVVVLAWSLRTPKKNKRGRAQKG